MMYKITLLVLLSLEVARTGSVGTIQDRLATLSGQKKTDYILKLLRLIDDFKPIDGVETPSTTGLSGWDLTLGCGQWHIYTRGGVPTKSYVYKWTVPIYDLRNRYHCVGSLIHPQVVLSVAHRFHRRGSWKVHAGQWKLTDSKDGHQIREVEEVVLHPEFHRRDRSHDIALLFLKEAFHPSWLINFLCLPPPHAPIPPGTRCIVTGWGYDSYFDQREQEVMMMVELPIMDSKECERRYKSRLRSHRFALDRSMLCAGGDDRKYVCLRDGGAPLACPYSPGSERFYQAGIVSFGPNGCSFRGLPSVYTNVAELRSWVDHQVTRRGFSTITYNGEEYEKSLGIVEVQTDNLGKVEVQTKKLGKVEAQKENLDKVEAQTENLGKVVSQTESSDSKGVAKTVNQDIAVVQKESSNIVNVPTESSNIVNVTTRNSGIVNVPTESSDIVNVPTESSDIVNVPTESSDIVNVPTESSDIVNVPTESSDRRGIIIADNPQ